MNKKIAIIADNSRDYVISLLEIWRDGDCAVLIDWRFPWENIAVILNQIQIDFCIVDERFKAEISFENFPYRIIPRSMEIEKISPQEGYNYCARYSNESALILFSSGTTGKSKGVVLSYASIDYNSDSVIDYINPEDDDSIYIMKTLSHSSTVVAELLVAVRAGITIWLAPTIFPVRIAIREIKENNVTIICLNPTLLSLMVEYINRNHIEIDTLKNIYISGSILQSSLWHSAHIAFSNANIYNVYGLTECGPRVAALGTTERNSVISVGRAIAGVCVQVRNSKGKELGAEEIGEIWVKTKSLFKCYLNKKLEIDKKGYFFTKDIGYLNEKQELFVVARKDNMIVSSSHNVFPEDLEARISNLEDVKENVVIGVDDEKYCNRIICLYTSKTGERIEDMRKKCLECMAVYEVPSEFVFVKELPKNINGKIIRDEIRNTYMKMRENNHGTRRKK